LLHGVRSARGAARDRIAVRIENRSANPRAPAELLPEIEAVLSRKGYEAVLAESTAGLPEGPGAETVLAVTVNFYLPPKERARGRRASPAVGLSARLIGPDTGLPWRNDVGVIGEEAAVTSGKRRTAYLKGLVAVACEQLLWTLPRARTAPPETPPSAEAAVAASRPPAVADYAVRLERNRPSGGARFPLLLRPRLRVR